VDQVSGIVEVNRRGPLQGIEVLRRRAIARSVLRIAAESKGLAERFITGED